MKEVLVDLRKYDLCDELEVDLISIEDLLSKLEDSLYEIKELKDKIKELETPEEEPDDYEENNIIPNIIEKEKLDLVLKLGIDEYNRKLLEKGND